MNATAKTNQQSPIKKALIIMSTITLLGSMVTLLIIDYLMNEANGRYTQPINVDDLHILKGPFIIRNVHVLQPNADAFSAPQDVLINAGKIEKIGMGLDTSMDTTVVDGHKQYLIPGLMDGHVHLTESPHYPWLFLVNGVTHVRDMGGTDYHLAMRDTAPEQALRPDVFVTSEKVYDTPWWQTWFMRWTRTRITMSHADQSADLVADLTARGFDGIKISNGLTAAQYHQLVAAAHQAKLLILGHIPDEVPIADIMSSGQQEIAHVEEITKAFEREYPWPDGDLNTASAAAYLAYVTERSDAVAADLKVNQIHVTSVVWLIESLIKQKLQLETFLTTVELAYVDPHHIEGWKMRRGWLPGHHSYASRPHWLTTPERKAKLKLYWDTYVDAIHIMTRALIKHQVPFTAGTDALTTGAVPGFSLHDELQSLVNLGLSPTQALQTATINPGNWLASVNKGKQSGQIKVGDAANLVLLRNNPLHDIGHTRSIEAVVVHGKLLNRQQLDTILQRIKDINNQERTQAIDKYL